jgi:2-polyprenyl-6-methoxyphenol hydroxylase-like FAD-dependent oxidoreductase
MNVAIRGSGVAALCSAHLLSRAGLGVSLEETSRPKLPVVMLSGPSLALMHDVFGDLSCLSTLPRIRRRIVAWGLGAEPVSVPHAAVVASEEILLRLFAGKLSRTAQPSHAWSILAAPPSAPDTEVQHFGDRNATVAAVTFTEAAPSDACWVESLESGWLFLIPNAPRRGYLLAVGAQLEAMLAKSRLVVAQIDQFESISGQFPAHPRIQWPLCGPEWLACGTAAMSFDPLCGDGVAHAVREAILASAVVQAAAHGADAGSLLAHYRARMAAGLARHIRLCEEFYQTGHQSDWWLQQLAALKQGEAWCARRVSESASEKLDGEAKFRYQLEGFELRSVAYAS